MLFKTLLWLTISLCFGGHAAYAQNLQSQPRGTITADTKITVANWQNFRQFMSEGMSALFEGNRFWRVPQETLG
jgi:hypothetical protein